MRHPAALTISGGIGRLCSWPSRPVACKLRPILEWVPSTLPFDKDAELRRRALEEAVLLDPSLPHGRSAPLAASRGQPMQPRRRGAVHRPAHDPVAVRGRAGDQLTATPAGHRRRRPGSRPVEPACWRRSAQAIRSRWHSPTRIWRRHRATAWQRALAMAAATTPLVAASLVRRMAETSIGGDHNATPEWLLGQGEAVPARKASLIRLARREAARSPNRCAAALDVRRAAPIGAKGGGPHRAVGHAGDRTAPVDARWREFTAFAQWHRDRALP